MVRRGAKDIASVARLVHYGRRAGEGGKPGCRWITARAIIVESPDTRNSPPRRGRPIRQHVRYREGRAGNLLCQTRRETRHAHLRLVRLIPSGHQPQHDDRHRPDNRRGQLQPSRPVAHRPKLLLIPVRVMHYVRPAIAAQVIQQIDAICRPDTAADNNWHVRRVWPRRRRRR